MRARGSTSGTTNSRREEGEDTPLEGHVSSTNSEKTPAVARPAGRKRIASHVSRMEKEK